MMKTISDFGTCPAYGTQCEYVAKVEAQAAEIERLREALTNICWTTIAPKAHKIAQAALAGKTEQ